MCSVSGSAIPFRLPAWREGSKKLQPPSGEFLSARTCRVFLESSVNLLTKFVELSTELFASLR